MIAGLSNIGGRGRWKTSPRMIKNVILPKETRIRVEGDIIDSPMSVADTAQISMDDSAKNADPEVPMYIASS